MRIDQYLRSTEKWPRRPRVDRLLGGVALGGIAAALAGCGATNHDQPGDGHEPGNNLAGSGPGGSGTVTQADGGANADGGVAAGSGIDLGGNPKYFRVIRLTN